ncbi:hypothetical protein BDV95DRAFT_606807 [Massariosphaeria phaeospora]|uniref:F-box domain-containing protein n=1 Tax=Massariosphaeria phaeospora TaxID=100035 RepID=A0A7C8I5I8_9PLEO|nr:hypothetical protein BDV95DRAFT_606807 [Massariosphaeria phaeospora]
MTQAIVLRYLLISFVPLESQRAFLRVAVSSTPASSKTRLRAMTTTPSPTPLGLLQLPAELRNRIYEDVLTVAPTSRLRYRDDHRSSSDTPSELCAKDERGFNQLKKVCRQLHAETVHLEIKYNDAVFAGERAEGSMPPGRLLRLFLANLDSFAVAWLSTVILEADYVTDDLESIEPLAYFCRKNPHVVMKYICKEFRFHRKKDEEPATSYRHILHFLDIGTQLSFLFRCRSPHLILPGTHAQQLRDHTETMYSGSFNAVAARLEQTPNLRFWPNEEPMTDEVTGFLSYRIGNIGWTRRATARALEAAKEWTENGI